MEQKEYFRLFTDDELTHGAELYYSGDLSALVEKRVKDDEKGLGGCHPSMPDPGTVTLSVRYMERGIRGEFAVRASIRLHEGLGVLCESDCNCQAFQEDGYGCAHTAGLLTAYMARRDGEDAFRGTRLETLLRNLTGAEDPFGPGALKRTDGRLLSLLKGAEDAPLPVWEGSRQHEAPLRIEVVVGRRRDKQLTVSLRAGSGKRLYVVKDLNEFLHAYLRGDSYALGRSEVALGPRDAAPEAARILDHLSGLIAAVDKGLIRRTFFTAASGGNRYMILEGMEAATLLELCDGRHILREETDAELPVALERKGLQATLKKKMYGATLKIAPVTPLLTAGTNLYLQDANGIFRVQAESAEKGQELLSLLQWNDDLYVRESEIGALCRNLLPLFQQYGEVRTRGLDTSDYEKERPRFVFQLDVPEDGTLSCKPYVVYQRQQIRCPLYDDETDAGRRNGEAENRVAAVLPGIFQRLDRETQTLYSELDEEGLFNFMREQLPQLEALGQVMATDSLKRNRIRALPAVQVGIAVESGHLLLSLKSTGLTDSEMSDILSAYRRKKKFFRLKSGEFLALGDKEEETWSTLAEVYQNYGKKDPAHIQLPAFRALYLSEMLEGREDADFDATEEYRKLVRDMDPEVSSRTRVPAEVKDLIRPYQVDGFRWICMLKRCGFGGILADDMGLGKTLQVLTFLLKEKQSGRTGDELRTLVVCPASLVYNWRKEIETYTPDLSAVVIAGTAPARKELIESHGETDVWITSYDLLKRDIALYEGIHFANEVIDEAQFVKNQKTQAAQSVRVVDSAFRMALTGTPIENYLSELWSIMDYLMPGFLYNYARFQSEIETPVVAGKDADVLERLRRMVHPFILRRLKKQVLKDLPDKMEEAVTVRMEGEQKRLYDASVEEVRAALDGTDADGFKTDKLQYLAMLTRLRQICCDPALIYEDYKGGSAKLDACVELVRQAITGGHKLLLFSQFTTMLDIIGRRLTEEEIAYHRIDGSVPKERRMEMVDSFANDDVPVFLISLKAGGTGLNLTAADIVIHYDPWWNQAAQDQATDRTHRIGQTERVTVYELIAQDTIEEKIQAIKEGKKRLMEDVLSGEGVSTASFDREDMLELLR